MNEMNEQTVVTDTLVIQAEHSVQCACVCVTTVNLVVKEYYCNLHGNVIPSDHMDLAYERQQKFIFI